jgi:hypothetical protein
MHLKKMSVFQSLPINPEIIFQSLSGTVAANKNQTVEPVSKRPTLANRSKGLNFQSSKYPMYSSG